VFVLVCCLSAGVFGQVPLPNGYQDLSGSAKREILWERCSASPYSLEALPTASPGAMDTLNLFKPSFLVTRFTAVTDQEGAPDRIKLIHTYGSTAKINWEMFPNSPYTGLFSAGSYPALARLSPGKFDMTNLSPGMAVKIFVDGKPSQNVFTLFSLDGQGPDLNYFKNPFWNIIGDSSNMAVKLIQKSFALALKLIPGGPNERPDSEQNMPLYEHASVQGNGQLVASEEVIAPYRLAFIPNPELSYNGTDLDFRKHLATLSPGTVIYSIALKRTPLTDELVVGQVTLESPLVASRYQDAELFFQHPSRRWRL